VNNQDSLKQSNLNYRQISKLGIVIEALEKRIKALEEKDGDYPNEEEIKNIKVGLTD